MIYDYYCTNCGHKLKGEDIVFDLGKMLDISIDNGDASFFISIRPIDLQLLALRAEVKLEGKVHLEVALRDLLVYLSAGLERERDKEAMQGMSYSQFMNVENITNLLTDSKQSAEVTTESMRNLIYAINAKLKLKEAPADIDDIEEWEEDTENYVIGFWVEPEFFPGTDEIYTVKFSAEENPVNLLSFENITEIRGYCPKCGKPVLAGSGLYEHYLVGFLGAQSAGKTSLFVEMINDLENLSWDLGIKFPKVLSDGKTDKLRWALDLNKHGWAVSKTDAQGAAVESFNASLYIESDSRKILLSFIDIAGELCYDVNKKTVNIDAFQKFPLITACHLYMLCTCVSQVGYGEAEGESAIIPNTALLAIAEQIYNNLKDPVNIPPLCLVITKVDMAQNKIGNNFAGAVGANPFDMKDMPKIPRNYANREVDSLFDPYIQLSILKELYSQTSDADILESLRWCCNTFIDNKDRTYLSIISCSALGMPARKYDKEVHDFEKDGDKFRPVRLEVVWTWILRNLGVVPAYKKYCFPMIPSYGEAYQIDGDSAKAISVRASYPLEGERIRIDAIYKLFLNPSSLDKDLHLIDEEFEDANRIQKMLLERKKLNLVRAYLKEH